jgi:hypothetical protein
MQIFNFTSNFIENTAKIICQKPLELALIIVPEKFYISPIKTAIGNIIQTSTIPTILSIEGLSETHTAEKKNILSRNQLYSKIFELSLKELSNEQDAAAFTRSAIGEIPNLYNNHITPNEILAKIPANISTAKEINLHLFVKIWKNLNQWLNETQTNTYFSNQNKILQDILHNHPNQIYIFHNFERSPLINNAIKHLSNNPNTTIFVQNYQKSHPCFSSIHKFNITTPQEIPNKIKKNKIFHVHSQVTEEKTILHLTTNFLNSQHEKIAIICQDETLGRKISFELSSHNISHQHNFSTPIESNSLIKTFLSIIESKHEKILPILQIPETDKQHILSSIVNNQNNTHPFWNQILNLNHHKITKNSIETIFTFLEQNQHKFHTNKNTLSIFLQFKHFILNEIQTSFTTSKHTILHIANSWKIWEEKPSSNIKICNLRNLAIQNFDSIIISSSFETTPTGNSIFSEGMRIYYGFSQPNSTHTILSTIQQPIFFTGTDCPLESSILELEKPPQKHTKETPTPCPITITETPTKLSATQIETLLENPLRFYYQHIKKLKEIPYKSQKELEIGNFIHKILEEITIKLQENPLFPFQEYIIKLFSGSKFFGMEIFYIKKILEVCQEISQSNNNISAEVKEIQTKVETCNTTFTITAKADRIDKNPQNITIFDYKTGTIKDYDKKIKKNKKIQLLIPALSFSQTHKQIFGKYISLEHSNQDDIDFEITQEILENFIDEIKIIFETYFIQKSEIPQDNSTLYSYFHVARI